MSSNDNICNYIHLPLQSGSNSILKSMNRTYSRERFLDLVDKIYKFMPNCSISTDIIVGFPGETDSDFKDTLNIVNQAKFNFSYMFKYSPRPGTKAVEFDNQISEDIKQSRLEELIALQNKLTLKINSKKIGTIENILIEKESKKSKDYWAGRTEGNVWTIIKKENEKIKDVVPVQITNAQGVTLFGKNLNIKDSTNEIN